MILQAVDRNVPEERLARALNIDISTLRQKKRALLGICPESVEILKDKPISLSVFSILRRMMPLRQMEAAEMMVGMNRYSKGYVQALHAQWLSDMSVRELGVRPSTGGLPPRGDPVSMLVHSVC